MRDEHELSDRYLSAQELLVQLHALGDIDDRVRLIENLCTQLCSDLYPTFLQILCLIERKSDERCHALVTDTLVYALVTERMPSGRLPAWGTSRSSTQNPFMQHRTLGPIEFVCAWYSQATNLSPLNDDSFTFALSTLLRLIDSNTEARKRYCYKLSVDMSDTSIGVYSNATRNGIAHIARLWNAQGHSGNLAEAYIQSTSQPISLNDFHVNLNRY